MLKNIFEISYDKDMQIITKTINTHIVCVKTKIDKQPSSQIQQNGGWGGIGKLCFCFNKLKKFLKRTHPTAVYNMNWNW